MLRVLIVDDEPLARLRLAFLVNESGATGGPLARAVAEAGNAAQALAWLGQHEAEVVLLDVEMPGLDGMGLAAKLACLARPPAVVFVTAHAQHAVRAFELEATDYLTKPVRRERLRAALERVVRQTVPVSDEPRRAATFEPTIVVNERGLLKRVSAAEVLYFKAELKYVTMRTAERTFVLDDSLQELEQRLAGRFLRIHRNALVAVTAIQALERKPEADGEADHWAVRVTPTQELLSVSRRLLPVVREAISRHEA